MAKLFITGATGFLGAHVLAQALELGHEVGVLVRDPDKLPDKLTGKLLGKLTGKLTGKLPGELPGELRGKLQPELAKHPKLTVHLGDVLDADSLHRALKRPVDALFHVAASTNMWAHKNAAQTQVNVQGVAHVLAAAKGRVGRFIDTSTVAVYGLTDQMIDENSPQLGLNSWINYAHTKALAQALVLESGLDVVVLNPTHLLGPQDQHNWARLIQLVDTEKLPGAPPGSGSFADVRQVAAAHLRAFDCGRSGECYLLGGAQASFLTLVQLIAAELGRKAPTRATPAFLIKTLARLKVMAAAFTGVEPDITPESVAFVTHAMRCDIRKAQAELGLQLTPLPQLVADTCRWMRGAGMLRSAH